MSSSDLGECEEPKVEVEEQAMSSLDFRKSEEPKGEDSSDKYLGDSDTSEDKGETEAEGMEGTEILKPTNPEINNPEHNEDNAKYIGKYPENCKIDFDLWQVKSDTIPYTGN